MAGGDGSSRFKYLTKLIGRETFDMEKVFLKLPLQIIEKDYYRSAVVATIHLKMVLPKVKLLGSLKSIWYLQTIEKLELNLH